MVDTPTDQLLFTYGTLQTPAVQLATFGRHVRGIADALPGYATEYIEIEDADVVELSGLAVHPILRHTGDPLDKVIGTVLEITADELDAADEYEVSLYRRVAVPLVSGRTAWVFVG